ncbi:MAG: hypothetical protein BGO98_41085 [Myxococcales bacterium 68-20]|nr:MAG: hypothetical protein BGO98_41085 [Myxococcales bacterium 68-20]
MTPAVVLPGGRSRAHAASFQLDGSPRGTSYAWKLARMPRAKPNGETTEPCERAGRGARAPMVEHAGAQPSRRRGDSPDEARRR